MMLQASLIRLNAQVPYSTGRLPQELSSKNSVSYSPRRRPLLELRNDLALEPNLVGFRSWQPGCSAGAEPGRGETMLASVAFAERGAQG